MSAAVIPWSAGTAPRGTAPHDVVHLEVGEPDFATPAHVVEAGARALRDGASRYVAPEGIAPLREALAVPLGARGHDAAPARVLVTSGAKPMLVNALRALLAPGDEALVPDPGYPGYRAAVALAGAAAVPYRVTDDAGAFALDVAAIARCVTPRTRVLVLNSPHNPTGGVATAAELDALAHLALRHDLAVVSDEVYSAITYDRAPAEGIGTRPGMAARTITVDSFSKTYAMTGWRLGYGLVPEEMVLRLRRMTLDTTTCTPEFVQRAGIAALAGPQAAVREMVATYRARRDVVIAALRALPGIRVHTPAGAFYAFAHLGARGAAGSTRVAERLLHEHGLACAPGASYGAHGERHVRLSFAASTERLLEGVARLARFLGSA